MPFPASGQNVKLGKGALMLALLDANEVENGFDFNGNANSISLASDITQVEIYSSTEAAGALLDSARTRIGYTLTASFNEFTMKNLEYCLAGTRNTKSQMIQTAIAVPFADVVAGRYYDTGYRRITDVIVYKTPGSTPLVSGTDYVLEADSGLVKIIDGGAIVNGDDIAIEFDAPALTIDQIRIAKSGPKIAHLLYLADDANTGGVAAKDRLEIWRVDVAPEGELQFISDDYGAFSLSMKVLTDSENHPDDPYGTLDRIVA